jgi:hypothetical protein
MLYMSGGGVQIFSMGIVFMLLMSPFKNVLAMNEGTCALLFLSSIPAFTAWVRGGGESPCVHNLWHTFIWSVHIIAFAQFVPSSSKDPKATSTLIGPKLVYALCNLLTLAVGLWKCRSMGLLPTGSGDWLAFESRLPVSAGFYHMHVVEWSLMLIPGTWTIDVLTN